MIIQAMPYPAGGGSGGDPYWTNVSYLSGFEGTGSEANYVKDESSYIHPGTLFDYGNTTRAPSATAKFGAQSFFHNDAIGGFSYPDHAAFQFDSGAFTLEAWVLFNTVGATLNMLFGQWDSGLNQRSWIIRQDSGNLELLLSSVGSSFVTRGSGAWVPSTGIWYHVAADFDGTTYRVYADGVMKASATGTVALFNATCPFSVGSAMNGGGGNTNFRGLLDEVRITKGVARYSSNAGFAVPTAAFPRS